MPIDGRTEIYGIIGWPVAHSRSPAMHNAAFAHLRLNKVYVPFPVRDVEQALAGLRALGVRGVSVTIPHKEAVIPFVDAVEPVAARIGAVNTLVIDGDGRITGYNTDWVGANRALAEVIELRGARAVLLGAGGSARAIGFGLLEAGVHLVLANRTEEKGRRLAEELGCDFVPLAEAGGQKADILVNATSAGMEPAEHLIPVDPDALSSFRVVLDIVYAPLHTRLLREAAVRGCQCVDGLAMLLYQGVAQFELWTGRPAPLAVMREILYSKTNSRRDMEKNRKTL